MGELVFGGGILSIYSKKNSGQNKKYRGPGSVENFLAYINIENPTDQRINRGLDPS